MQQDMQLKEQDRIPEKHLQALLEKAARIKGFTNPSYAVRPGSKVGDNYVSLMYRVEMSEGGPGGRKLQVMVKSALQDPQVREAMQMYRAFTNEVNFYNIILPYYAERMWEAGMLSKDGFYPNAPRCYLAQAGDGVDSEQDALILEDMRPLGFGMLNRTAGQDVRHCLEVLRALAHLHASSFAAERLDPEGFPRLRDAVKDVFAEGSSVSKILDGEKLTPRVLEMIRERFPEGTIHHEKAKKLFQNVQAELQTLISPSDMGGNVINHGDCWTNNILFRHSDAGEVQSVCLIDFQLSRYASPVLDLSYFLYTCTELAMRRAHLDALLREYHAALLARVRALGVPDPVQGQDAVLSWTALQRHLQRYARFGLVLGSIVTPLIMASTDEVPDIKGRLDETSSLADALVVKYKDSTEINRRMSDVLEDLVERGYL